MKMRMSLLVSALALLLSPAVASPTHNSLGNRKRIIELAEKYNNLLTKDMFVEDVSDLVESGCKDEFFCKVHDILQKHYRDSDTIVERKEEKELMRNLKMILPGNCTALTKDLPHPGRNITVPRLLEKLTTCTKKINFTGDDKSSN